MFTPLATAYSDSSDTHTVRSRPLPSEPIPPNATQRVTLVMCALRGPAPLLLVGETQAALDAQERAAGRVLRVLRGVVAAADAPGGAVGLLGAGARPRLRPPPGPVSGSDGQKPRPQTEAAIPSCSPPPPPYHVPRDFDQLEAKNDPKGLCLREIEALEKFTKV